MYLKVTLLSSRALTSPFRLFLALPKLSTDGEGKVELPGGVSIFVSRVGPGVFFARFGTILVGFSFTNVLSWDRDEGAKLTTTHAAPAEVAKIARSESFSYVSGSVGDTSVNLEREALVRDLRTLRKLELALSGHADGDAFALGASDTASAQIAFPRVKRMMLHSVWDDQWGDYQLFADWVRDGARSPPVPSEYPIRRRILGVLANRRRLGACAMSYDFGSASCERGLGPEPSFSSRSWPSAIR